MDIFAADALILVLCTS